MNNFNMFFVITFKHDKVYLPGHEPTIYTITFVNWDGTVLQTSSIEEGQTPVYTGSTPTRPSDSQYNYTFNGWLPTITEATQDVTYIAQYTATAIQVEPYVTFTAEEAGSTLGLAKLGNNHTLEYRTDGQSWTPMTTETSVTLPNVSDKVYIRGILLADQTNVDYTLFTMTGKIAASGNCNAIWNYENLEAPLKEYCGFCMFEDCTSLTQAPELPATILAAHCYSAMFRGCTILTQAPSLPATTLADSCYSSMLSNCKSITTGPLLPAMTLTASCYSHMFGGCESLTQAPSLPATTLADSCYEAMFTACVNLTTAPDLPATTLVNNCYKEMFTASSNLSSIKCLATNVYSGFLVWWTLDISLSGTFTKAAGVEWPEGSSGIPNHWIVKIDGQYTITFANWDGTVLQTSSIEEGQTPVYAGSTPTRPSDGQYNYTFNGWTPAIAEATQDVTYTAQYTATAIPVERCVTFTAEEAGSTLGLNKLGSVHTLEYSTDAQTWTPMTTSTTITLANINDKAYVRGILSANLGYSDYTRFTMTGKIAASGNCNALWNYQDLNAPLKEYCGNSLFANCASLTKAPELPATTLASDCYCFMFYGCTSLTQAPELPAMNLANYCYNTMFRNCTSLTQAPELPAMNLANYCYNYMFSGCTSLTQAPELPATRLVAYCYHNMFKGCTSLSTIKCLATDISANGALTDWTNEVASSGTFTKATGVEWPTGTAGIPSGWTVVEV